MVEGAFQVRFRQDKKGGKLYLTIFELRASGLWEALRHAVVFPFGLLKLLPRVLGQVQRLHGPLVRVS